MLIIEGSDCLGKTTFAKKLVRYVMANSHYPCIYSWMTRPNEDTFDFLYHYKLMINSYTVQDRFHLGALVYHEDKLPIENLRRIEEWIKLAGGLVVLFYASNEDWYERYINADERGNLLANDILCKANSRFKDIVEQPRFNYYFDISHRTFPSDYWVGVIGDHWISKRRQHLKYAIDYVKPYRWHN